MAPVQRFFDTVVQVGPDDLEVRVTTKRGELDAVVVLVRGPAEDGSSVLLSHEPLIAAAACLLPGAWHYVGHDVTPLGTADGEPLECSYFFARETES